MWDRVGEMKRFKNGNNKLCFSLRKNVSHRAGYVLRADERKKDC